MFFLYEILFACFGFPIYASKVIRSFINYTGTLFHFIDSIYLLIYSRKRYNLLPRPINWPSFLDECDGPLVAGIYTFLILLAAL